MAFSAEFSYVDIADQKIADKRTVKADHVMKIELEIDGDGSIYDTLTKDEWEDGWTWRGYIELPEDKWRPWRAPLHDATRRLQGFRRNLG